MLASLKIKMVAYYVKNKKCFRRHLGLSRHFDFLTCQQLFYYIIRTTTYQKMRKFHSAVLL
jgi:hypothetical protein